MSSMCGGLTILDLTEGMAGALVTMILADAGAEVIKIEPPEGDPTRAHPAFIMWNRGKKSVVLDVNTKHGIGELRHLASTADVLLTTLAQGGTDGLGMDHESLTQLNPALVLCSISGFGPLKEYAHLKCDDGIVAAKTGRMRAFDEQIAKDGPIYAAVNCASFGAAMHALQGIMAALHVRRRTGRGQRVETSLLQGLFAYDYNWIRWQWQHKPGGEAMILKVASPPPQYFSARCKDGRWIQMSNALSHLLVNWVVAIGADELLDDPRHLGMLEGRDWGAVEDVYELLQDKMARKTVDEWMEIFTSQVDVAAEPFLTTQQGLRHPQVLHNGNVIELHDPMVGATRQLGPLVIASETPLSPQGPAPSLGEHTHEILTSISRRSAPVRPMGGPSPKYPLSGITVVDFGLWLAGPVGSAVLADMGARAIKVESLGGDTFRGFGYSAIRAMQGKEAIAVDLKKPDGKAIAYELIRRADIVMSNQRVSAAERLGIGYEQVRKINPRAVYLYAGSYGSTGPDAHRPAMHPIPGAISGGALYQAGRGTPPPPDKPLSYPQIRQLASTLWKANEGNPDITSALAVASAALLGLHARETTGKGQYLETTMLCSCLYANSDDALDYEGKPERLLPDEALNGLHALYRLYPAKEGWVFLSCTTEREWQSFCRAASREDLARDSRFATRESRLAHDEDLATLIQGIMAERTAAEWEHLLSARGLGCAEARATGFDDFANTEPAMREAGLWLPVEHFSLGQYWRYGPAVTFSDCELPVGVNTVAGEHTQALLKELGYSDAAIDDLARRNIVNWPGRMQPAQQGN